MEFDLVFSISIHCLLMVLIYKSMCHDHLFSPRLTLNKQQQKDILQPIVVQVSQYILLSSGESVLWFSFRIKFQFLCTSSLALYVSHN